MQERTCWEQAEGHLLAAEFRERLDALGVGAGPEVAAALMAAAMLLAEGTEEWGGDARDAMGNLAALGYALLEDDPAG